MLTDVEAVELCSALERAGVRYLVIGGWGVDALLGRETRTHKDLDILAVIDDLPQLREMLDGHRMTVTRIWEESRPTESRGESWPTAFVATDPDGRELDVHLIGLTFEGEVIQHFDNPWPLPDAIDAVGTIAGRRVPCVSAAAQARMHEGYVLPAEHELDIGRLASLP